MLGRAWFQNEAWEAAVNHFTKSAELRTTGQAYDWLHLAMAYHHLGQHGKSQNRIRPGRCANEGSRRARCRTRITPAHRLRGY